MLGLYCIIKHLKFFLTMYNNKLTATKSTPRAASFLVAAAAALSFGCQKGHVDDKPLRHVVAASLLDVAVRHALTNGHPVDEIRAGVKK